MTRESCDQLWRVEAALDGRLDARSVQTFEGHLTHCAACRDERAELLALKGELRQIGAEVDEASLLALRRRTLKAAVASRNRRPRRAWGIAAALLAACGALALIAPRLESGPSVETSPRIAHQAVLVTPERGTRWKRNLERGVERVMLASGVLTLRVARKRDDPRLIVTVPDGEIEDLGTVFSVSVASGKTVEIRVDEGRVLFHRQGLPSLTLAAGSTFRPLPEPQRVDRSAPAVVPPESAAPSPPGASKQKRRRPAAARPQANEPLNVPGAEAPDGNMRGEDAAYLRILDLLRRGRADEARRDADAYLRAYPEGFRSIEVKRVVRKLAPGEADGTGAR